MIRLHWRLFTIDATFRPKHLVALKTKQLSVQNIWQHWKPKQLVKISTSRSLCFIPFCIFIHSSCSPSMTVRDYLKERRSKSVNSYFTGGFLDTHRPINSLSRVNNKRKSNSIVYATASATPPRNNTSICLAGKSLICS